jgi:hypothetical protein
MRSTSGLIKIPKQLLNDVTSKCREILLSYAYNVTRLDANVAKHHDTILKLLSYYKIKPIEAHLLDSVFKVTVDDSDLPQSYQKYKKEGNEKYVVCKLDHVESEYLGAFQRPNVLIVCAKSMYNILLDSGSDTNLLFSKIADFDNTIEHELTHWVQITYLHPDNSEKHYTLGRGFTNKDYYSSKIEFDPTIKSELSRFSTLISEYYPSILQRIAVPKQASKDVKQTMEDAALAKRNLFFGIVGLFTGSLSVSSVAKIPGFENSAKPSPRQAFYSAFFETLKMHKPDDYKKALTLFGAGVVDACVSHKTFVDDTVNIEAERLDYVFCRLRANEFCNFARIINTFIAFPESRLADFEAMRKYLDRIDNEFKLVRSESSMFVDLVDASAVESIVLGKRAFSIRVIFVIDEIHDTGIQFDVSGLPMLLDIAAVTRDDRYAELCDLYDIKHIVSPANFAILDGIGYKFQKRSIIAVYKNGVKQ